MKIRNKKEAKIYALKALSNMAVVASDEAEFEDFRSMELFNNAIDELCDSLKKRADKLTENYK